jgi:L-malate glycosyltransferase
MRVAILAPNYYQTETGNAVTVRRIERHLKLLGCELRVFPLDQFSTEQLLSELRAFAPQLLHAFHGYHGGRAAHALAQSLGIPYLVTLTGTDVYQALSDQRSHDTHAALRGAGRIVAFHASVKKHLAEHLPSLDERTVVIPQGVVLPDLPAEAKLPDAPLTFFLPAGLRRVKNVLFPLEPLAELQQSHPRVILIIAGPILDPAYAAEVMETLERYPFARYLGGVRHDDMSACYRNADVVLNTSIMEGGMANSVLEALSYAKPVLVSDIDGNRSIIKEGVTGLLFHDEQEFLEKAGQLVNDPHLRQRLGKNGRSLVQEKCSPEVESLAYLELYQTILQK